VTSAESNRRARCLIVVPVYNEAHRLQQAPFFDFLAENQADGPAVFLLFVNDGSTDGTLAMLEAMQLRCPERIFILDKKVNGGKGEAIRDGMATAFAPAGAYKYVGFWDADLATPLSAIPQLLAVFEQHPHIEMVFGSRVRLLGRHIHRNPVRHYLGRIFATVASYTLSLPIYDTQCGAKIFKVSPDLEYALGTPFLSRWIFDVEIVAKYLQLRGLAFCAGSLYEFPLDAWEDVAGSKLKPLDFLHAGWDIFRIHRRYLAKAK
jgi:glycosyltransferase involved in cell wall biosynthesis